MKKLKAFGILGAIGLAVVSFCLSILLAQPSDATSAKYQRLIAMGVVDAVVTADEIGLDYLSQETMELAADPALLSAIYEAEAKASVMPEDIALEIPNGTNSPISVGQIPDDPGTPSQAQGTTTEAFVNASGQIQSITPSTFAPMFETEHNNRGNLARTLNSNGILIAQTILLSDASGGFLQAQRIPVINLVVRRNSDGRRFVVRRVNANAFCRDALNAILTDSWQRAEQSFSEMAA